MKAFIFVAVAVSFLFFEQTLAQDSTCASAPNATDCEECIRSTGCFYCDKPASGHKTCQDASRAAFLTDITSCPGYNWKWGQCTLNGIVIAVLLALFIVLIISCCCVTFCCIICVCRRRRKELLARNEYRYQREREAIKEAHARKKEEKAARREEIKKKYGLFEDSGNQDN